MTVVQLMSDRIAQLESQVADLRHADDVRAAANRVLAAEVEQLRAHNRALAETLTERAARIDQLQRDLDLAQRALFATQDRIGISGDDPAGAELTVARKALQDIHDLLSGYPLQADSIGKVRSAVARWMSSPERRAW